MHPHIVKYRKSGIATAMIAVIVVIIVVIAGVGAYIAMTSGGGTTQTSSTSSAQSTSKTSSATTASSVATTTSSAAQTTTSTSSGPVVTTSQTTSSSQAATSLSTSCSYTFTQTSGTSTSTFGGFSALIDLFGNFSQMTIVFNTTSTSSYQVVGKPTINGIVQYEVNYDSTFEGQPLTGTAYFAPNGTITQVVTSGATLSGYQAYIAYAAFTSFLIEAGFAGTANLYTTSSFVSVINHTTVQLGPSSVSVTNYGAKNLPFTISECGYTSTVNKFSLQIGQVSGVNYNLLTYADFEGTSQGTSYAFVLQVTSVSK